MNFAIVLRNFDEILPEFHRNVEEMTKCLEILRKSAIKNLEMLEISGICENFHFSFYFFIRLPSIQWTGWLYMAG